MPVAVVTGASQGFGRALATDLAKEEWSLVIDARRSGPLSEVAESLEGLGVAVRALPGDITDPDHRAALVDAAVPDGGVRFAATVPATVTVTVCVTT